MPLVDVQVIEGVLDDSRPDVIVSVHPPSVPMVAFEEAYAVVISIFSKSV